MRYTDKQSASLRSFHEHLKPVKASAQVSTMKNCTQHGSTSVYRHSVRVAYLSYRIASALPVKIDYVSLVNGAFLHDYFLYDWHEPGEQTKFHGFSHPKTALENAKADFDLNQKFCLLFLQNHIFHQKDIYEFGIMTQIFPHLNYPKNQFETFQGLFAY